MSDRATYYCTTPIYYVNAKPHLGSLYSTLLADVATRWHKLLGKDTFMLTGTDEHGQKIAEVAQKAGKPPQEFVDSFIQAFKDEWHAYGIEYNHFMRTTDEFHKKGVRQWLETLLDTGDIYKAYYTGWYCVPCETYLTEKEAGDSVAPACPSCSRSTTSVSEESYFFRLSAYQDRLLAFYAENQQFITPIERMNEVLAFVKSGLKDLSISRTTVMWGIPFPRDEKHVTYVWADALNNYITAIGYGDPRRQDELKKWWPADLQVLGKDIVRFHAVYWPAFLMAIGLEMPRRLLVHGWLKIGEQKMSKSLGNVIDPAVLRAAYGADPIRYYLTRYMAITQDSPFSIDDLEQRISSDLANDLGNLLNRLTTLALKNGMHHVKGPDAWDAAEIDLRDALWTLLDDVQRELDDYYFHRAYAHVAIFVQRINSYFHGQEPWKVAKQSPERFAAIIAATCHSLHAVALLLWPVMPSKMNDLLASLGVILQPQIGKNHIQELSHDRWARIFHIKQIPPLFEKYERKSEEAVMSSQIEQPVEPTMPNITFDDLSKIELIVGTIEQIEEVPKSDKLYRLQVNFGPRGMRQICSGIKKHFKPEELLGKQSVFVFNLAPRKMMGLESQGMMLSAGFGERDELELIMPRNTVPNGSRLS